MVSGVGNSHHYWSNWSNLCMDYVLNQVCKYYNTSVPNIICKYQCQSPDCGNYIHFCRRMFLFLGEITPAALGGKGPPQPLTLMG